MKLASSGYFVVIESSFLMFLFKVADVEGNYSVTVKYTNIELSVKVRAGILDAFNVRKTL